LCPTADFGITSVEPSGFTIKTLIGRTYTKHNYRKHGVAFNTPFPFSGRFQIKDVVGVLVTTSTVEDHFLYVNTYKNGDSTKF
jgi:hypothetical protein